MQILFNFYTEWNIINLFNAVWNKHECNQGKWAAKTPEEQLVCVCVCVFGENVSADLIYGLNVYTWQL